MGIGGAIRTLLAAVALILFVSCVGEIGTGAPDADPNAPDADPNAPDADPNAPDADPNAPDADLNAPDSATASIDASVNEPSGLTGITAAHNVVRAEVGQAPLTWDPALAAIAQAWADQCIDNVNPIGLIDHNPNRSDSYPGSVGENIYGSGSAPASPTGAVNLWASEKSNYDPSDGSCAAMQICGHYTQIVWSTTTKLGCGVNDCSSLQFRGSIVCNYSPAGNSGGPAF